MNKLTLIFWLLFICSDVWADAPMVGEIDTTVTTFDCEE